jgi:mannose-1-phosphate guanylyltransferase
MATTPKSNHYALILCGGSGPRLWPISDTSHPKPFLKIYSHKTLLEETYNRLTKTISPQNIYIISNEKYKSKLSKYKNVILEPEKKNTAMAILYACSIISKINPDAIISSFPADHYISKLDIFHTQLETAKKIALNSDKIVTFGVTPSSPNTSYGYIQIDKKNDQHYSVKKFIEKPDIKTVIQLITKKSLWNSGIYTFKISTLIEEFKKLQPDYYQLYQKISSSKITDIYKKSNNLSLDKAISEKTNSLVCIPVKFIWNDIGQWNTIHQQLPKTGKNFSILDPETNFLETNSSNCLISSTPKKLVGLVGVNNLAIIDTPEALLVCSIDKNDSWNVRDLVTKIVSSEKTKKYFLKNKNDK